MAVKSTPRLSYVWDYGIDESEFQAILEGRLTIGRLDQDWAAQRLIEYAPYEEIIRLLGFRQLIEGWPRWRKRIRSVRRRRGFDFLSNYLTTHHPELIHE